MIIYSVRRIAADNVAQYAWRRLAQFNNIDFTASRICNLHNLNGKHASNARKQAEQIKYCLLQAKEYFDSSKIVSLSTRPVLLYYCAMSLALSEVLMKQTADSRLSQLRKNHGCHGLTLTMASDPNPSDSLFDAATKLVAKAQVGSNNEPKGTFEVWRNSAREYPLGGFKTHEYLGASSVSFDTLFVPADEPPPKIPREGVSLQSCLANLPYMADTLSRWGARLEMVRATVDFKYAQNSVEPLCTVIIHPASSDLLESFGLLCKMPAHAINSMNITELPSGYIFKWVNDPSLAMTFPHSTCINTKDTYFTCSSVGLGEFGYIYVALHILGNFARYYPDLWVKHIEENSPLANAADDLCNYAMERLPILCLSELSRSYNIVEK